MATIITRETGATAKGSPLTNLELDNNFINLNTELGQKLPLAGGTMTGAITFAAGQTWPTFNQNTTGSAATLTTARTIGMTGDVTWTSAAFNGSDNVTGTATLANSGVTAGAYGSASAIPIITVDAKGRVTALSTASLDLSTKLNLSGGTMTGSLTNNVDVRAPIFYDSDNTGYYVDPTSTSKLVSLNLDYSDSAAANFSYGLKLAGGLAGVSSHNFNPGGSGSYRSLNFFATGWNGSAVVTRNCMSIGSYSGFVGMGTDPDGYSYRLSVAGSAYASSDFRAPIFYDSDNTGYWTNPNASSVLDGLKIVGANDNASGADFALWIQGHAGDWGIGIDRVGKDYGIQANLGTTHSYAYRALANSTEYFRVGTDQIYHNSSIRAPIFYDTNDTNYYCDPNNISVLRNANFWVQDNSTCSFTNSDLGNTTFTNRGGRVLTSNGTNWLADGKDVPITVSGSWTHTNRGLMGILLHNEANTTGHYSPAIAFSSLSDSSSYNSTYALIMGKKTGWNGGVDTNWNVGELHMFTIGAGYIADEASMRLWNHGDTEVRTSLRAPTFYDKDNTSYYADFASTGTSINTAGDIVSNSDRNLKENIEPITNAIAKIRMINGVTYNKIGEIHRTAGVIAQDVEVAQPELVTQQGQYKSVAYGNMAGLFVEAIKEQQMQIESLRQEINTLKGGE